MTPNAAHLSITFTSLAHDIREDEIAASALGYGSVKALQNAIAGFCAS